MTAPRDEMAGLALLIPAYNATGYLPRLLRSANAQSPAFDEVLVYDDASTDDTAAVAEQFGARVVRGLANVGCSHGKNALAAETRCAWLHFHDADDELRPGFVAACREWIERDDCDAVIFSYDEVEDATGSFIASTDHEAAGLETDALGYALRVQINPFCGLYRKSAFEAAGGWDVDPLVLYNEDVAFHIRLAQLGLRFSADPRRLVINHRRVNSMSAANRAKCLAAQYHVMRKAYGTIEPRHHPAVGERLWGIAAGAAAELDWVTADAAAELAAKLSPPDGRIFGSLAAVSPRLALRVREAAIRTMKPNLRRVG